MRVAKYWIVITSPENFAISRGLGFQVDGFKDNKAGHRLYKMKPGDQIVYYINRVQKFGAITEITGKSFRDDKKRIWAEKDEIWPLRIPLKLHLALADDQLVDVRRIAGNVSFITRPIGEPGWAVGLQGSIRSIPDEDFAFIASEIRKAAGPQEPPDVTRAFTEDEAKAAIMSLDLQSTSLHDRLGEMLQSIGIWMGYNAQTRYPVTAKHSTQLDVAWLRETNPDVGIEVQIGGSIIEAQDRLDEARSFNYRKVIMVIEESQLSKLNSRIWSKPLRHWLDAWSIQAVYRLYTAGSEYFTLYKILNESRFVDRHELELVK